MSLLVREALEAELERLRGRDERAAGSPEAALALSLASCMDNPDSTTSAANIGKTLLETLVRLRALALPEEREDGLDELTKRRERRLAGGAAT